MSGACWYCGVEEYGISVKTRVEVHGPAILEGETAGD